MDKIVIVTDHCEGNVSLIAYLRMLFPECEIQVLSRQKERFVDFPVAPEHALAYKGGKKNGKHLNCR